MAQLMNFWSREPRLRRMSLKYPPADREVISDQYFGQEVADPYRWLEDEQSAATKKWSAAQEELWQNQIKQLSGRAHW